MNGLSVSLNQATVVALGSNLGDRLGNLLFGLHELRRHGLFLQALSSVYETPPLGYREQPEFLNLVLLAASPLPPEGLLSIFQAVEEEAGRERGFRNGPRTLDVDLVLFGKRIVRMKDLQVPHPRWRERSFVAVPLAEIAPRLQDPETGWRVEEISDQWPMEPQSIRVFAHRSEVQNALEEWER